MKRFDAKAPFADIPRFDPNGKSDEVLVQVIEKPVPVPEPPKMPALLAKALAEMSEGIVKLGSIRPEVQVSVSPTPLNIQPALVQVTPPPIIIPSPLPATRRWLFRHTYDAAGNCIESTATALD